MDYQRIYNQIIMRAQSENRVKGCDIYFERHHIIPSCIGGSDDIDNLVLLTAREHYLAHRLLCKIHPNNSKLAHAFWMMCNGMFSSDQNRYTKISANVYEEAKIQHSKFISKVISESKLGKKRNPFSEEWKRKLGSGRAKKVICIESGIIFERCADACRYYNIDPGDLSSHINKNVPKSLAKKRLGGLHFKFL